MTATDQADREFAQQHDHTSPTNGGCKFCVAVEMIESFNPAYKGVPLAQRRVKELKRVRGAA